MKHRAPRFWTPTITVAAVLLVLSIALYFSGGRTIMQFLSDYSAGIGGGALTIILFKLIGSKMKRRKR